MGLPNNVLYLSYFGQLDCMLSAFADNFVVDVDDKRVDAYQLRISVHGSGGDDDISLYGTPAHSVETLLEGNFGEDNLKVVAGNSSRQRLHGLVIVDGLEDEDQIAVYFAGTGSCDVLVRDNSLGLAEVSRDFLQIYGHDDTDDKLLLRISNISNLHPEMGKAEHVGVKDMRDISVFGLGRLWG